MMVGKKMDCHGGVARPVLGKVWGGWACKILGCSMSEDEESHSKRTLLLAGRRWEELESSIPSG